MANDAVRVKCHKIQQKKYQQSQHHSVTYTAADLSLFYNYRRRSVFSPDRQKHGEVRRDVE